MKKTMTARFADDTILKAVLENSDIKIITLDEDGDEVTHAINYKLPDFNIKVVNASSDPAIIMPGLLVECGIDKDTEITIPVGETLYVSQPFGTPDGNMYVGVAYIADYWQQVTTASELVNCADYGGTFVIIDPTEDASCTITVTDGI